MMRVITEEYAKLVTEPFNPVYAQFYIIVIKLNYKCTTSGTSIT